MQPNPCDLWVGDDLACLLTVFSLDNTRVANALAARLAYNAHLSRTLHWPARHATRWPSAALLPARPRLTVQLHLSARPD